MNLAQNKLSKKLFALVSFLSIVGVILSLDWILFQQVDLNYLDNLYSFSQWSIPLSSRIMGDSLLYQHSGTQLIIKEFEPFMINPETPVLGKLFLGISIVLFGNPHIFSIISLILLLFILNLIAKKVLNLKKQHRYLLLLLTGTSPIILEQIASPLLDLPQVTFFLFHLYFLFLAGSANKNYKNIFYIIASGIALGGVTAIKIAFYFPIIFILDAWYLRKKKKGLYIILIILITAVTYLLTYLPYIVNHGVFTWLKAQKWMLNFYFNSDVVAIPGMMFITAITGWYKGWWGAGWERIPIWSGSWLIGFFSTTKQLLKLYLKKIKTSYEELYLLIVVMFVSLPLLIVPFWTRYFVFFVPFFWLNTISWLKNKKIILLLLLFPLIHTSLFVKSSLEFNPDNFYSLWEKASYEDMYDYLSLDNKSKKSRENWTQKQLSNILDIDAYEIDIKEDSIENNGFMNKTQNIRVTEISFKKIITKRYELKWKLERSQWKLDYIEEQERRVDNITSYELGFICINPTKVENWSDSHEQASSLLKLSLKQVSEKIMLLVPRDYCIPIGEFTPDLKKDTAPFKPGIFYKVF